MNELIKVLMVALVGISFGAGCVSPDAQKRLNKTSFDYPIWEAEWIRSGEPIEFEGELWYPSDDTEILLDNEVFLLDEYKGVEFFIEKTDVRPYNNLFTKFGHNKFRIFTKVRHDD